VEIILDKTILIISGAEHDSDSAYQYRIKKFAELLEEHSIRCDFLFTPETRPLRKVTTSPLFMPLFLGQLRKYKFIYCGAAFVGQAFYLCFKLFQGVVAVYMHGDDISQSAQANQLRTGNLASGPSLRVKLQYSMTLRSADYILTQSEWHKSDLIKAGVKPDRISVVRNGVDLELFQPLVNTEKPSYTFGYAGEFQSWQGIDDLVSAFEKISNPEISMLLIGFRESNREVKKIFSEKFGPRVKLVDRTDRKTMLNLLGSTSILISPRPNHIASRAAFPVKFAEYAALGRPILVNDVDETADFIRKYDCGFVSSPPNPENLARTMELAASTSPETLIKMGVRSRKMAEENFSWPKIGDDYATLVQSLTEDARSRELKKSGIFKP
ncbi:MAG: glycosyltransferase, partial [Deltaproteobacteria bacterium]|nr:glycosyltransferase [Deltaproteobacteria bacterium]